MKKGDGLKIPDELTKDFEKEQCLEALYIASDGNFYSKNSENIALLMCYDPFLKEINGLIKKFRIPELCFETDHYYLERARLGSKWLRSEPHKKSDRFRKELRNILIDYRVMELYSYFFEYLLWEKKRTAPVWGFNFYNRGSNGQKSWMTVSLDFLPIGQKAMIFKNHLMGFISDCEINKSKAPTYNFQYKYLRKDNRLIFDVCAENWEIDRGIFDLWSDLAIEIADRYFSKYKPSPNLKKNILILTEFRRQLKELAQTKKHMEAGHDESHPVTRKAAIEAMYPDSNLSKEEINTINENLKSIDRRVLKKQQERFGVH